MDENELEYVCETMGNRVVPTAATVLSRPDRRSSIMSKMNYMLMLHGEQRLAIHQPLLLTF